ncbi:hypothetical protein [Reyranella sp.]|uniref:hypothetical protein n=1 Tax=Reyranella sp. TaxID=1929291 RepID=UPI003BA9ED44
MPDSGIIDIRISDIRQLFNSLDPSPFHERDLDRDAEEFIVGWADEYPLQSPLELVIRVPREQLDQARQSNIPEAIHNYFSYRAVASARRIRFQLREGRFALAMGLAFLAACILLRQLAGSIAPPPFQQVFQEGLLILGWVAMWRPLQLFLYDWWPVRHHGRLYRKLAAMKVTVLAA